MSLVSNFNTCDYSKLTLIYYLIVYSKYALCYFALLILYLTHVNHCVILKNVCIIQDHNNFLGLFRVDIAHLVQYMNISSFFLSFEFFSFELFHNSMVLYFVSHSAVVMAYPFLWAQGLAMAGFFVL